MSEEMAIVEELHDINRKLTAGIQVDTYGEMQVINRAANAITRLTDENAALREQLRWRKWPDEKPPESDEYLVEQWIEVKWAKDLNCKLFSVLDWHNGKWVKPSGKVMCWLPIPQDTGRDL